MLSLLLLLNTLLGDRPRVVTVCELMKDLKSFNGKILAVRGELSTGPEEFTVRDDKCGYRLVTEGHSWPCALWLTPPGGLAETPVNFRVDETAFRQFWATVNEARAKRKSARVVATFVGKLETRTRFYGGPGANSPWIGNGFGHLNAYPGQVVLQTVKDVLIE